MKQPACIRAKIGFYAKVLGGQTMTHKKAIGITVIVSLLWSVAGFNIKMIDLSGFATASGRSFIAAILLTPLVLKKGKFRITRPIFLGGVCYAGFCYCFHLSTKLTTAAIAIMMQYTAPIYVALLSWIFLREKIEKADIISMLFIFSGMLLFFADDVGGGSMAGNIISIFNGIFFAGISISLRLQKDENPILSVYFGNILCALIGIPFFLREGLPDAQSMAFLLLAGVLCAVTYALYAAASTKLSAFETVILPVIDPVLNPVWVFLLLGERPGVLSILGAAIVLIAVTVRALYSIKKQNQISIETSAPVQL